MMVARGPHFVEQETVGRLDGAVQVVGDAAFFAARRRDQGAEFGFEKGFLAGLGRRITTKVTASWVAWRLRSRALCVLVRTSLLCVWP